MPQFLRAVRLATNGIIILLVAALLVFMFSELVDIIYTSFLDPKGRNFLHDIALILVFVKAVKMLTEYLKTHRIAISYLMEISIIAPAIEIIFAADKHDFWLIVIFGIFSMGNLLMYLLLKSHATKILTPALTLTLTLMMVPTASSYLRSSIQLL
jgi:uncharacterized membrane protein (DUF373 family)